MRIITLTVLLGLLFPFLSFAEKKQEKEIFAKYKSIAFGAGTKSVYDSYLSPLIYKGIDWSLKYEGIKKSGNSFIQSMVDLNISKSENPAKTANYYTGTFSINAAKFYSFNPIEKFQMHLGAQWEVLAGGIYNTRNGNNPATGKAHTNLNLSGIIAYHFKIKNQNILLRYQSSLPFIGIFFSPEYGQSYYEIGRKNNENNIHLYFSSFHNYRAIKNEFSVEFPLPERKFRNNLCLRLTYQNWIYQTTINKLQTKIVTSTFFIGFSKDIYNISIPRSNFKENNIKSIFGE